MGRPATKEQRLLIESCLEQGVPFAWRGPGTLLIQRDGLMMILPGLTATGVAVLGFERFEWETTILPRLDLIFDAGRRPDIADPVGVLKEWPADVWIDVVLSSS
jgi:hypothetical protein